MSMKKKWTIEGIYVEGNNKYLLELELHLIIVNVY